MKQPTQDEVRRDATTAATYFVALTSQGVPNTEAAAMSSMYLAGLRIRASEDQTPGDEWKGS